MVYTTLTHRRFSVKGFRSIIKAGTKKEVQEMSNKLIAFYSRADENYVSGILKYLTVGNTEVAASIIKEFTDADILKVEQVRPYSKGYNECIAEAQADQKRDARPELKTYPDSLSEYDTIYLGFPNYWSTMPMAVFAFLEHFDFSGKTIKPFCTHEGSGMGVSERDIKRLCPTANVAKGLAIHGSNVEKSRKAMERWTKE
jgi:flavodoxin